MLTHFGSIFKTGSQRFDFSVRYLGHVMVWLAESSQEATVDKKKSEGSYLHQETHPIDEP